MDLRATIGAVRAALIEGGGTLNPPVTESALAEKETMLGLRLPDALRQLYRTFDGSLTATEDGIWNFWPLGELDFADSADGRRVHLLFCDALIWAPVYGIRVDPLAPTTSEVWGHVDKECRYKCSASVERFLERFPNEMGDCLLDGEAE